MNEAPRRLAYRGGARHREDWHGLSRSPDGTTVTFPRAPEFDGTRAFIREGYDYVGNRCRALNSDGFTTRLMMRPVVCMMGEDAARRFYDGAHFSRAGAMPAITLRLLQDKRSVQMLSGDAHRHRKALMLRLLTGDAVARIGNLFASRWRVAQPEWRRQGRIVLHDAVARLLCDGACAWAGVAVAGDALSHRTREMKAMIDGAGSAGPRAWCALLLRRRAERWARGAILAARQHPPGDTPVSRLAHFRDGDGRVLAPAVAAVELLNLIRPTVAVARFITFAALALHEHEEAAAWLDEAPEERVRAFADEVRRFYPFFPVIGGRVRQPFAWQDHQFATGDWVLLGLHATNHDARLWDDPATFRPERFQAREGSGFDLIPPGAGAPATDHRCPGEHFTTELVGRAVLALRQMRYRVPPQRLDVPLNRFPTLPRDGFVIQPG